MTQPGSLRSRACFTYSACYSEAREPFENGIKKTRFFSTGNLSTVFASDIMTTDELALSQIAIAGSAKADPDPWPRPDGYGSSIEPARIEGDDYAGNRPEPGARRVGRR